MGLEGQTTSAQGSRKQEGAGGYRGGVAARHCQYRAGADHESSVSGGDREGLALKRKEEKRIFTG